MLRVSCVGLSLVLISPSPKMMIHEHTKHKDGFIVLMNSGVNSWCVDVVMGIETLDVYIILICMLMSL